MCKQILFLFMTISLFLSACQKEEGCDECGGSILDGYLFKKVTTEDLSILGTIEDIEVDACIRYQLDGTDFDLETVKVVDDCCCEQ